MSMGSHDAARHHCAFRNPHSDDGVVLILIAGILSVLGTMAGTYIFMSGMEKQIARNQVEMAQAKLLARSGVEYAMARLRRDPQPRPHRFVAGGVQKPEDDWTYRETDPGTSLEASKNPSYNIGYPGSTSGGYVGGPGERYVLVPAGKDDGRFDGDTVSTDPVDDNNRNGEYDACSGRLRGLYGAHTATFKLKIEDANGRIHINGSNTWMTDLQFPASPHPDYPGMGPYTPGVADPDELRLTAMINNLARALKESGKGPDLDGTEGAAIQNGRPLGDANPAFPWGTGPWHPTRAIPPKRGEYTTWGDVEVVLEEAYGPAAGRKKFAQLKPYLTLSAWVDPKVIRPDPEELSNPYHYPETHEPEVFASVAVPGSRPLRALALPFEPRAPVNVNRASKEVLIACLTGLRGHHLGHPMQAKTDNTIDNKYDFVTSITSLFHVSELPPLPRGYAGTIADRILTYRNSKGEAYSDLNRDGLCNQARKFWEIRISFPYTNPEDIYKYGIDEFVPAADADSDGQPDDTNGNGLYDGGPLGSWRTFENFVDGLPIHWSLFPFLFNPPWPSDWPNTPEILTAHPRTLIEDPFLGMAKAMANPNTLMTDFGPESPLNRTYDKQDLSVWTTEFSFVDSGLFTIESLGQIRGIRGREHASAKVGTDVELFGRERLTTQEDFESWTFRQVGGKDMVQSGPEHATVVADLGPAKWDGWVRPAERGVARVNPADPIPQTWGPTLFEASYDAGLDAETGSVVYPKDNPMEIIPAPEYQPAMGKSPSLNRGVWNGVDLKLSRSLLEGGNLSADGYLSSARRNWHQLYYRGASDAGGVQLPKVDGVIECWVKPDQQLDTGWSGHHIRYRNSYIEDATGRWSMTPWDVRENFSGGVGMNGALSHRYDGVSNYRFYFLLDWFLEGADPLGDSLGGGAPPGWPAGWGVGGSDPMNPIFNGVAGQWHHLMAAWEGTGNDGSARFWVDGKSYAAPWSSGITTGKQQYTELSVGGKITGGSDGPWAPYAQDVFWTAFEGAVDNLALHQVPNNTDAAKYPLANFIPPTRYETAMNADLRLHQSFPQGAGGRLLRVSWTAYYPDWDPLSWVDTEDSASWTPISKQMKGWVGSYGSRPFLNLYWSTINPNDTGVWQKVDYDGDVVNMGYDFLDSYGTPRWVGENNFNPNPGAGNLWLIVVFVPGTMQDPVTGNPHNTLNAAPYLEDFDVAYRLDQPRVLGWYEP
jgi:hypothetical protein